MEIYSLLESLEDLIENSKKVPFSDKTMIDSEEVLDLVKEIRLKMPDELKQAKWIQEERERILNEAHKEAEDIVNEAENKTISMINEHEITRQAYDQKTQIIAQANDSSRQITSGAKAYADNILADLQETLETQLKEIQNNRKELK